MISIRKNYEKSISSKEGEITMYKEIQNLTKVITTEFAGGMKGGKSYHLTPSPSPEIGEGRKITSPHPQPFSLMRRREQSAAFTLAETLITVVILGILAAILVPNLIKNQVENANRTKVKKAMAAYEKAINYMIIENDIKSSNGIKDFGEEESCKYASEYFKKVQKYGENNCVFKTPDKVWWNISDLSNPIIILKDELKVKNPNELRALAKDFDNKTVFALIGRFDEVGSLRVDDNGFEQSQENNDNNKNYMTKLWSFINNVVPPSGTSGTIANGTGEPQVCDYICKFKQGNYENFCASNNSSDKYSCQACKTESGQKKCDVYNENGIRIGKKDHCNSEYKNCKVTNIYREDGSTLLSTKVGCVDDGENCLYKLDNIVSNECSYPVDQSCANKADCHNDVCDVYGENGVRTTKLARCTGTLANYDNCHNIYIYDSDGTTILEARSNCINSALYCGALDIYGSDGKTIVRQNYYNTNNGNLENYSEFTYTADGKKVTSEINYYTNGKQRYTKEYSDDGKRLLKETHYKNNGIDIDYYEEPIYDANGNRTGYKKDCNANDYCGWIDTYNAQGNRTIKTYYDKSDGSFKSYDENIYAADGKTKTGTRTGCNQQGVCTGCTGSGC